MDNSTFIVVASAACFVLVTFLAIMWHKHKYNSIEVAGSLLDAQLSTIPSYSYGNLSPSQRVFEKAKFTLGLGILLLSLDAALRFPPIFSRSMRGFYACIILFSGITLIAIRIRRK
jgi:hypothetical protein